MVVPNNHRLSYLTSSFWGALGVPPFKETPVYMRDETDTCEVQVPYKKNLWIGGETLKDEVFLLIQRSLETRKPEKKELFFHALQLWTWYESNLIFCGMAL